jgi:predicted DNA-binding transcriptional regulator AlpA
MKKGHFPNAIKISQRAIGWIESEIDEWIMQKAELASPK